MHKERHLGHRLCYVPIIVMPHPPQVGQQRGFVTKICPQGRGICTTTLKALNTILNALV